MIVLLEKLFWWLWFLLKPELRSLPNTSRVEPLGKQNLPFFDDCSYCWLGVCLWSIAIST